VLKVSKENSDEKIVKTNKSDETREFLTVEARKKQHLNEAERRKIKENKSFKIQIFFLRKTQS